MIYLYTGTPGSGKSLDLARIIYYRSKNHPIYSNFPVALKDKQKQSNYHFMQDDDLTPSNLIKISQDYFKGKRVKEDTIYLLIDEAQLYFNSRDWSSKDRKDWVRFFSGHRHYGYIVILSCQIDTMIDKQIRALVEIQVIHRKLNNYGLRGFFLRVLLFSPTLFVRVVLYYQQKMRLSGNFFRYHRKYACIYDTFSTQFFDKQ